MKTNLIASFAVALLLPATAFAADDIKISADTSGLPAGLVQNMAHAAKGLGVKEPMNVSATTEGGVKYAVLSGSTSTSCRVKLSNANPPVMQGISCR